MNRGATMDLTFDSDPDTSLELEPARRGWVSVRVIRDGEVRKSIAIPGTVSALTARLRARARTSGEALEIINRLSSPAETGRCIRRSAVFGAAGTGDGRTIEDQG
jgi:hypothetical protein